VSILSVWNILAVNEKMDEKLAYAITKTIFEKKPELVGCAQGSPAPRA